MGRFGRDKGGDLAQKGKVSEHKRSRDATTLRSYTNHVRMHFTKAVSYEHACIWLMRHNKTRKQHSLSSSPLSLDLVHIVPLGRPQVAPGAAVDVRPVRPVRPDAHDGEAKDARPRGQGKVAEVAGQLGGEERKLLRCKDLMLMCVRS